MIQDSRRAPLHGGCHSLPQLMHLPSTQARPAHLQLLFAQHFCQSPPQGSGFLQTPLLASRPQLHLPPAHTCACCARSLASTCQQV